MLPFIRPRYSKAALTGPTTTEDCLFLDVIVPKKTFESSKHGQHATSGSPVLVWIRGGGYSYGEKTSYGNPAGIVKASNLTGSDEIVVLLFTDRLSHRCHCGCCTGLDLK